MLEDKTWPNFLYYCLVTSHMQTKGNVSETNGKSYIFKIEEWFNTKLFLHTINC